MQFLLTLALLFVAGSHAGAHEGSHSSRCNRNVCNRRSHAAGAERAAITDTCKEIDLAGDTRYQCTVKYGD